jgi:predicted permease
LKIPIVLGRGFAGVDSAQSKRVAVINSAAAKRYFTGNPVGRTFTFGKSQDAIEVVGVSADAKYDRQRNEAPPTVYMHWAQDLDRVRSMHVMVKTSVEPVSVMPAVRRAVAAVDPTLPVANMRTQRQTMSNTIARERTFAVLATFFSGVALLLACIGIYGVLAYSVSRRTSEFGIRLALGASASSIRWMVLRGTIILIAAAIVIGVPVTIALGRVVENRLYGVKHTDALTMALAAAVIVCTAFAAAWLPSLRASRSDPAVALRYE